MPISGSQVPICDLPVRYDTYAGCTHGCDYCFAKIKNPDPNFVKRGESVSSLRNFIAGNRNQESNWCDWDIPLHFGGMSDPLQPAEATCGYTLEALEVLRATQYPFLISTKGALLGEDTYIDMLASCNAVVQVSLVAPSFDKLEVGAPTFAERVEIIRKIAPRVKRVIVRCQPYIPAVHVEVLSALELYAAAGVHGVIFESIKLKKKRKGMIKCAGDLVYPLRDLRPRFLQLKKKCHALGLRFYSGENRLRRLSDDLCCCGVEGLDGFRPNNYNLNHLLHGEAVKPTKQQAQVGTAACFKSLDQSAGSFKRISLMSFEAAMRAEMADGGGALPRSIRIAPLKKRAAMLRLFFWSYLYAPTINSPTNSLFVLPVSECLRSSNFAASRFTFKVSMTDAVSASTFPKSWRYSTSGKYRFAHIFAVS